MQGRLSLRYQHGRARGREWQEGAHRRGSQTRKGKLQNRPLCWFTIVIVIICNLNCRISKLGILLNREQSTSTATRARVTSGTPSWSAAGLSTSAQRRRSKTATSSRDILTALPSSPRTTTPYNTCSAGTKIGPEKDSCILVILLHASCSPFTYSLFYNFESVYMGTNLVWPRIESLLQNRIVPLYVAFHFAQFGIVLLCPMHICHFIFLLAYVVCECNHEIPITD